MRPLLCLLAALIALAPLVLAGGPSAPGAIVVRPLPAPRALQVGRLHWLGGWAIDARDRRFGGFSGIALDGGRPVLLSDAGWMLALGSRPVWREIAPEGDKAARDSESLARDPASGRWWIGFEGQNLIARLRRDGRSEGVVRPAAMRGWPANGGAESLARLPDGRFVAIAETATRPDGAREALLFPGDPLSGMPPIRFGYRPPAGTDPSDAAALPDGRLLVLNRRLGPTGFSAVLVLVDPARIRPGASVAGTVLARLGRPLPTDNMEGVAVGQAGGRTILWLVSDDNFLPVQRTLLIRFALRLPPRT